VIQLSEEQVIQLAPDASSLKSGKDLASEKKWLRFYVNERALWGEVQGSGRDPYRTQIDIQNIAFKCSCPSRKFPCKHGIGLFILFARQAALFESQAQEPDWVQEWINKRQVSATKPEPVDTQPAVDTKKLEKQAKDKEKRSAERWTKVAAGVAELELWTRDLVRNGLLSIAEKEAAFWNKTTARMVDAQASGLGNLVREYAELDTYNGNRWHSEALQHTSKIFLLLEAFKRWDTLPELLQEDVKNLIGWTQSQKELLESPQVSVVSDQWLVMGKQTELQDDLTIQRNWLYGVNTGRYALVLNFAYKSAPIPTLLIPATRVEADLVFFPSVYPLRAAIKQLGSNSSQLTRPVALPHWDAVLEHRTEVLSQYPWADMIPYFVDTLTPVLHASRWLLKDRDDKYLEINKKFSEQKIFQMLALSGGLPVSLFLLQLKNTVYPLGIWQDGAYYLL
jgi:hypothetical protein